MTFAGPGTVSNILNQTFNAITPVSNPISDRLQDNGRLLATRSHWLGLRQKQWLKLWVSV